MSYVIRRTDNIDLINLLHQAIFPEDEIYEPEKGNKAVYWVLWDGSRNPVGFAIGTEMKYKEFFLSRAGLLPSARGKGLHKRLIRVRERHARAKGFKYVITYTARENITSAVNLNKMGYYLYMPDDDYAGPNFIYFMKELR